MAAQIPNSNIAPGQTQRTALAILPDRALAQQFLGALSESRAFQISVEWTSYPSVSKLMAQLRQARPDVVLIDVSSNVAEGSALIDAACSAPTPVPVIALHTSNSSPALLDCLRAGATEFLYAPFTAEMQRQAVARIASRFPDEEPGETPRGRLVVFSSAKPGSGRGRRYRATCRIWAGRVLERQAGFGSFHASGPHRVCTA